MINCLACIDLNPLRAGLVDRPEEYRWNSLGYHIQTGNKDIFMSKREKVPKPVAGLDGVYSLKRLSEMAFF